MSHGDSQVLMWYGNWRWHRLVGFLGPAETFDDRWKTRARVAEQVIDAVRSQTGKERFGSGDRVRGCLGHDRGSSEAVGLTTLRLTMMQIENTFRVIGPQLLVIPWDCSLQHHILFLDRILDT
jgi:hypothetical protein